MNEQNGRDWWRRVEGSVANRVPDNGIRVRRTRTIFPCIIQTHRLFRIFFYVVAFKYFMACLAIVVAIQPNENSFKLWQRATRVYMRNTMMRKDENDENVMAAAATTTTKTPHKSHAISWKRTTNERQYSGRKVAYFKMPQLSMFRPSPFPPFLCPNSCPFVCCGWCTRLCLLVHIVRDGTWSDV